jgi:hypothetical protein
MKALVRYRIVCALLLSGVTGCTLLCPQRFEDFLPSMRFYEAGTLFLVVERQVEYRTVVVGTEDRVHSSARHYYRLGFGLPKTTGLAVVSSIEEAHRTSRRDGQGAPSLYADQLAPLVSHNTGNLFLGSDWVAGEKPAGATWYRARRWNGSLWYLVRRNGEPDTVTNEDHSVTYTCPPLDIIRPNWDCWDADAGLILLTAGAYTPSYEFSHLPPKVYLWYYRENRVETYTIDRVAVDKALRRFIRQHD